MSSEMGYNTHRRTVTGWQGFFVLPDCSCNVSHPEPENHKVVERHESEIGTMTVDSGVHQATRARGTVGNEERTPEASKEYAGGVKGMEGERWSRHRAGGSETGTEGGADS
jgi:hypothetical protein